MVSNWRDNVADLIGPTRTDWLFQPFGYRYYRKVAQLTTPLFRAGYWWTHLVQSYYTYGALRIELARRYPDGSNVLNQGTPVTPTAAFFPYGFSVLPDHT